VPVVNEPTRICVMVPADDVEAAKTIAARRGALFSEEVRRALRAHVAAETRRLGLRAASA
jgi:hypothetical protein